MLSIIQQKRNINNLPYYMYNIIQLNDKDLSELQVIAKELGIKKTDEETFTVLHLFCIM